MTHIVHGQCGKTWTGLRREHCAGCHETFNSTTAGDRHRRGGRCLDPGAPRPEGAGLFPVEHPWGICWQTSPPGAYIPGGGE